ncbi:MAG: YitT family protein [Muribaculaceae bacterium]|nr:YitT family protein [Muribaculaceae bacterium]
MKTILGFATSKRSLLIDYFFIIMGIFMYAFGFCAFILPHKIVMGGLSGVGTLVYFASDERIPVAVTQYVLNLVLLAFAYRVVGKTFVVRTIFGATMISLSIGAGEAFFMNLGHPIIEDITMSAILGAIVCGLGIGTVLIHNGSTGGTDIIASMVNKLSNVSIGRAMVVTDIVIVSSSIFLPYDGTFGARLEARVPFLVYGYVVTFVASYCADMIITGNRQAVQFIIFSRQWEKIADAVNNEAKRGVTVLDGEGWYTKKPVKVLLIWCRKIEAPGIMRLVKGIDDDAFITQGAVNGVFGKGFDLYKVRIKPKKQPSAAPDNTIQLQK